MNCKSFARIFVNAFALTLLGSALSINPPISETALAESASATATPNANSPLGTNLGTISDWSSEWAFVDAFKPSRPWLTQCTANQQPNCTFANEWDTGEENLLDLDASGWVRSLPSPTDPPIYWYVGTLMLDSINGHYPAGQYIVLYDGAGTITYGDDAVKDTTNSSPGRDVLNVTPTNAGIYLAITATDPSHTGNYIRNIRVIMPGYESIYSTQIFHPTFLARIQQYSVLRFNDWMDTLDGSTQGDWTKRPLPTDARWNTATGNVAKGVPVETMVALANRIGADPWFNMPHLADDNYVTQFATLVLNRLGPGRKVYVEYSNEVWNDAYPFSIQANWVEAQGLAMWPSSSASAFTKRMNWFGRRTAQICDIWKSVWGAQRGRVKCVMGSQSGNTGTGSQPLDCALWTQGAPCTAHGINALAIAPYFGYYIGDISNQTQVQSWTLDNLFNEIFNGGVLTGTYAYPGGALKSASDEIALSKSVARARGIDLVAYEGGQHLVVVGGTNTAMTNLFISANRDARMGTAYAQYLARWKTQGGTLFNHYNNVYTPYGVSGSWGALEYLDQTSSPKYDALMQFIAANPCWWNNCSSANTTFGVYLPLVTR